MKEIGKSVLGYDFRNEESAIFIGDEKEKAALRRELDADGDIEMGSSPSGLGSRDIKTVAKPGENVDQRTGAPIKFPSLVDALVKKIEDTVDPHNNQPRYNLSRGGVNVFHINNYETMLD